MSDVSDAYVALVEAHRPYGMDCKCGRPINSDRDWARHLIEVLQLAEEWRYEGEDEHGGWVSVEVFEEKPSPRSTAYAGGKLVDRLVGPWREVSRDE